MNQDERRKLYAALAAPFPESCIQRTDGRTTGRGYSTTGIGYQHIVNRLNEVLGVGGWRAHREITVKEIATASGRKAYEAVCDLILELGEWTDGEFVVFAESLADGGHVSVSEADARKGSYTNGLKKAAAMFGVGRQAYEGTLDDDNLPADGTTPPSSAVQPASSATHATQPVQPPQSPTGSPPAGSLPQAQSRAAAPARNRLTSRQLAAIWALGRKVGLDQTALRTMTKSQYGAQPEFLTREAASALISALNARVGNGHAQEPADLRVVGQEG